MRAQIKELKALEARKARKGLCPDDAARRDVALTDVTLLLIAGGLSSRMGRDKRFLQLGGRGLLERTLQKARAEHFQEIILCVENDTPELRALAETYRASLCRDDVPRQGPMAGLAAGLSRMTTSWALALSSDMPFFDFAAVRPLREACQPGTQAVLPVAGGRRQPLAAFYHQSFAEACRAALRRGERRLCHLIEQTPHLDVAVAHEEAAFFNVNTPADLRLARGRIANETRRVPIVSIVAPASGTGKTTFIERLLPRLLAHGLRVGVVKSDAHGFQLDQEGKDSWRFTRAGATGVAVVSPAGWVLMQKTPARASLEQVAAKMEGIDLLLSESRTHGTCPALSLWRGRADPMTGDDVAVVFAKGLAPGDLPGVRQFDLDDSEEAARLCLFLMGGNRVKQETGGKLNHFDAQGQAIMVDVGEKPVTQRTAVASGRIFVNEAVYRAITEGTAKKGDVLGVARLAGIMAAKRTSDMIPLCHPLFLSKCSVDFDLQPEERAVKATACVKTSGQTGVEMEALHAVSVALLTIYDMCKALDRRMEIREIHLERKEGGKSGIFIAAADS